MVNGGFEIRIKTAVYNITAVYSIQIRQALTLKVTV